MVDYSTTEMQENIGSNYQLLTWPNLQQAKIVTNVHGTVCT